MRNKNYTIALTIIFAILISSLVNSPNLVPSANAQGAGDAYFTSIEYSIKVYDNTQDSWNFTVYNANLAVDVFNRAWFFFKFYLNNTLWYDEYVDTGSWQCNKGSSVERSHTVSLGSGPVTWNVKVEVYWDNNGTFYLEDTVTFTVTVAKVFVKDWSPSTLTVEKGKTAASTLSISFKNGGNDYMYSTKISVTDSAGLEITPQSQTLQDIASGGTKSTSFSVTAPSTATIGTKSVSFKVEYDDFRGVSHSETKTASITVGKLGTSITLSLQPSSLKKGSSTTITAKLVDGNNNPLANKDIGFYVGTTSLGSATTDSSGNAVKTYTANLDAGTYIINASYSGSIDYGSSNATSNLIVNPFSTTLTIDVPSATQGKSVTITATLKDENGNPLQNMNIDFQLYDGSMWTSIGSDTTDSSGAASITYTPSSTGTFQVKAMFSGTTNYSQLTSTTGSLGVGVDYTPYYIGGGIVAVAIIGVIGYMVFRKKKKATLPTQQNK